MSAGVDRIAKEGTATNLAGLFTKMLVYIRRETFLDMFMYRFICKVVLFERGGSDFLPRKGLPLPPYRGVVHGYGFDVRVKSIPRFISIAHPKNKVEGAEIK